MSEDVQTEKIEKQMKKWDKMLEGGKKNASSIGMSASVLLSWATTTFAGVPVPPEVVAASAGLLSSIATNLQNGRGL